MSGRVPPCLPGDEITMEDSEPVLVCPWHGWQYDVATGRCLHDPDTQVRAYEVKVEDGRVWVEVR